MKKLVDQLNSISSHVCNGLNICIINILKYRYFILTSFKGGKGAEKARHRHTSKGKLLVRDRIKYLLDPK